MCDYKNPYGYSCAKLSPCSTYLAGPTGATGPIATIAVVPVGSVLPYAGATAPEGYLFCDGAEKIQTAYPALYEIIGTTYGSTSPTTTFKLPDLRARIPVGVAPVALPPLSARALGASGGVESVTLSIAQIPGHSHPGSTAPIPATVEVQGGTGAIVTGSGAGSENIIVAPQGGGEAHTNMQPFLVLNYIIKY
jgi:microcystin-dependent protein